MRNISAGTMSVVILAIFAGLFGAYAIRAMLAQEEEAIAAPVPVEVPLASADLPAGRVITLGDISLNAMSTKQLAERELPLTITMLSADQIVGRRLTESIGQGEPFLTTSFYLEGMGPGVEKMLKPGFRAYSLRFSDMRAGWVQPGLRVDVLFRANAQSATGDSPAIPEATLTLAEDIEVLQIDHSESELQRGRLRIEATQGRTIPTSRITTVMLAVTPEQANFLQATDGRGELSLVARPESEALGYHPGSREALTLEDLLGIEPPPPPIPPLETEVYRRTSRQVNQFERNKLTGQTITEQAGILPVPFVKAAIRSPSPPDDRADAAAAPDP